MKLRTSSWVWIALLFATGSCAMRGGTAPRRSQYEARDVKHQEILLWYDKIVEYRKDLGLSDQPEHWLIARFRNLPVIAPLPSPTADVSDQCRDVCDLAERICEAQKEICSIADELGEDDTWAQEKCDSAKASCDQANKRCTNCQ